MPAVIRGGRRQAAPPARKRAAAPRGQGRAPQPRPGFLDQGLTPGMAWAGVGTFAFVAVAIALFGWGADISRATGRAIDGQFAAMGFRLEQVHVQGASAAGQRAAEPVALQALATSLGQKLRLAFGFDPFADDVQVHPLTHAEHGLDDGDVRRRLRQGGNERTIDLEYIEGVLLEIVER